MTDKDKSSDNQGPGKKTLTLKGAPNLGQRPGMSCSSRITPWWWKSARDGWAPRRWPRRAAPSSKSAGPGSQRPGSGVPVTRNRSPRQTMAANLTERGAGLSPPCAKRPPAPRKTASGRGRSPPLPGSTRRRPARGSRAPGRRGSKAQRGSRKSPARRRARRHRAGQGRSGPPQAGPQAFPPCRPARHAAPAAAR